MIKNQIILVISVLSILYLLNNTQDTHGQKMALISSSVNSELTMYENSEKGISILYPSNWQPLENEFGIAFFSLDMFNEIPPGISILIKPTIANSVEDLVNSVITDTTQSVSEFKLVESSPFTLGGMPGYIISFTYVDPTQQMEIQTLQAFTIKNGKDYGITYQAPIQQYSTYFPVAQMMIDSFQFIESPLGTLQ